MQSPIISIVYHSNAGHTAQLARFLATQLQTPRTTVHLLGVEKAIENFDLLHQSDMIIFGSPTYFGNISAAFKQFMEATGGFWYTQLWKNKLAAGFTISSSAGGDKLNSLQAMQIFAAQHGMHWINLGVLPRYIHDQQTDGQNRLAAYIGLMAHGDNSQTSVSPLHPGDMLTAELFAKHLLAALNSFNPASQQEIIETSTNQSLSHA